MDNIKEIAVIIAVNKKEEHAMCPAVSDNLLWKIEALAQKLVKSLKSSGIFAVASFVDIIDLVSVNETAPCVHNSVHHTSEGNFSYRFNMLWRVMFGYPPGCPNAISYCDLKQ